MVVASCCVSCLLFVRTCVVATVIRASFGGLARTCVVVTSGCVVFGVRAGLCGGCE